MQSPPSATGGAFSSRSCRTTDEEVADHGRREGSGAIPARALRRDGLTRENAQVILGTSASAAGFEVIIHCACNSAKSVAEPELYDYYADNVVLTSRLSAIPHRKFVFFSSVDVYDKDGSVKYEDGPACAAEGMTPYSFTKLVSEALVKKAGTG